MSQLYCDCLQRRRVAFHSWSSRQCKLRRACGQQVVSGCWKLLYGKWTAFLPFILFVDRLMCCSILSNTVFCLINSLLYFFVAAFFSLNFLPYWTDNPSFWTCHRIWPLSLLINLFCSAWVVQSVLFNVDLKCCLLLVKWVLNWTDRLINKFIDFKWNDWMIIF